MIERLEFGIHLLPEIFIAFNSLDRCTVWCPNKEVTPMVIVLLLVGLVLDNSNCVASLVELDN